jgi:hypothetical protein
MARSHLRYRSPVRFQAGNLSVLILTNAELAGAPMKALVVSEGSALTRIRLPCAGSEVMSRHPRFDLLDFFRRQ